MTFELCLRHIKVDKHLDHVTALLREGFPHENWTCKSVQHFMGRLSRHNCLQVLLLHGNVVGCVLYSLKDNECHIRRIVIDKNHRRRGLGRFIINDLRTSSLAKRDFVYRCRGDNENGWRFIKSFPEFKFDVDNRHQYEDGMDCYRFRCEGIRTEKENYATVG